MMFFKRVNIRSYEMGLYFRNGEFKGLLGAGTHWILDLLWRVRVQIVSRRDPWLVHVMLDMIVKSGALVGRAEVVDLKDHERALVWIDGRFSHVLSPGLYAYWTGEREVKVEVVDARGVRFEHDDLKVITRSPQAERLLDVCAIERSHADMKDLMNRVTEAKKAAEANLIARREETAAMRSQANTAKLLADNPTLMRLRELEVLEKVACNGKLNVVLGEQGLADRIVNLL